MIFVHQESYLALRVYFNLYVRALFIIYISIAYTSLWEVIFPVFKELLFMYLQRVKYLTINIYRTNCCRLMHSSKNKFSCCEKTTCTNRLPHRKLANEKNEHDPKITFYITSK